MFLSYQLKLSLLGDYYDDFQVYNGMLIGFLELLWWISYLMKANMVKRVSYCWILYYFYMLLTSCKELFLRLSQSNV